VETTFKGALLLIVREPCWCMLYSLKWSDGPLCFLSNDLSFSLKMVPVFLFPSLPRELYLFPRAEYDVFAIAVNFPFPFPLTNYKQDQLTATKEALERSIEVVKMHHYFCFSTVERAVKSRAPFLSNLQDGCYNEKALFERILLYMKRIRIWLRE
jgi:hypothetical protein